MTVLGLGEPDAAVGQSLAMLKRLRVEKLLGHYRAIGHGEIE